MSKPERIDEVTAPAHIKTAQRERAWMETFHEVMKEDAEAAKQESIVSGRLYRVLTAKEAMHFDATQHLFNRI